MTACEQHEICQSYVPFTPRATEFGDGQVLLEITMFNLVGVAWWVCWSPQVL